jgi:hypothetical protein
MGLRSYDRWLTSNAPGEIDTAFERWCEEHEVEPDDDALRDYENEMDPGPW